VLGTAAYLSPEQAAGEEAGPQADLYSLGVVTYQCLAGRLPYEAGSLSELVLKQQREAPPRLDQLRADVGPALARAVSVALAIDPRDRYRSAREMGDELDRAAEPGAYDEPDETGATRAIEATAPTSILGGAAAAAEPWDHTSEFEPVARRQPVPRRRQPVAPPAPAPAPSRRAGAAPAAPRKRRGRTARLFAILLIVALVAAGVGIAIVTSMSDSQRVQLRNVVYDGVDRSVDAMKQLINDNQQ